MSESESKHPSQGRTQHRYNNLSDTRRALFEQRLRASREKPTITASPHDQPAPLSYGQQRLWFLQQIHAASTAYNVPINLALHYPVQRTILQASLNTLVQRHHILRTYFDVHNGQIMQFVREESSVMIEFVDLHTAYPDAAERQIQLEAQLSHNASCVFDLWQGHLLTVILIKMETAHYVLSVTMHHIITDAISSQLFLQELLHIYQHLQAQTPLTVPQLTWQYRDFARWQRSSAAQNRFETAADYWRNLLIPLPALPGLPRDVFVMPPPTEQSTPARLSFQFSPALSQKLQAVARDRQMTNFMLLLSLFYMLLAQYTRMSRLLIGVPVMNRTIPGAEHQLGFWVNTLPLLLQAGLDQPMDDWLQQTRNLVLNAAEHQQLPYEKIVEIVNPQRSVGHDPLFNVMFGYQEARPLAAFSSYRAAQANPLPIEPIAAPVTDVKFEWVVIMSHDEQGFTGEFEYDAGRISPAFIEASVQHFQQLAAALVADSTCPVANVKLMSVTEQQLLQHMQQGKVHALTQPAVHHFFEASASRHPQRIALVDEAGELSYHNLNQRAAQFAAMLQAHGVQPQQRVAYALPRSRDLIIAILGILKAGAVLVPLDLSDPPERLRYVLNNSQVALLICADDLPLTAPPQVRVMSLHDTAYQQAAAEPVTVSFHTEQLVYIIYTSGSTGQPKGIGLPHRVMVNLVEWQQDHSRLASPVRTLQASTLSFDVAYQEIFCTLGHGDTLVMVSDTVRKNPEELLHYLSEKRIERLYQPFVGLQSLAQVAVRSHESVANSLKEIITAGEQLQATEPLRQYVGQLSDCRLFNHYGPSETHVVSSYALAADPMAWDSFPSIGRPLSNVALYVLDDNLRPVPRGVVGELFVSGEAVAREYIAQPRQTAAHFWPDPFSDHPGQRMYKTGDRVVWRSDGQLQFAGRTDQQVKIRGFRVEPGEIEYHLAAYPALAGVAVGVREAAGSNQLVAWYTTASGEAIEGAALRDHLALYLPDYMQPAYFVHLAALPRTSSGKIDRRALYEQPLIDTVSLPRRQAFVAPRTPVEEKLVTLWSDLLDIPAARVGIHDNFFDLGGHSLLAISLQLHLQERYGWYISLKHLFTAQTISDLALLIEMLDDAVRPDNSNDSDWIEGEL